MSESHKPKVDWDRTGSRVVIAIAIVLAGLTAFYLFGRSDNAAQTSRAAALAVQMDAAQAKSDAAQTRADVVQAESMR